MRKVCQQFLMLLLLLPSGCGELTLPEYPRIEKITPSPAVVGEKIMILGAGFRSNLGGGVVSLDDAVDETAIPDAYIKYWSDGEIVLDIPNDTLPGVKELRVRVSEFIASRPVELELLVQLTPQFDIEWRTRASLPYPLQKMSCAVQDGKILVVGGENQEHQPTSTLTYNPLQDQWDLGPKLVTPRSLAGLARVEDELWVFGGQIDGKEISEVEAYSTTRDRWEAKPGMRRAKSSVAAFQDGDRVLLFGGQAAGLVLDDFDRMHIHTGQSEAGALPKALSAARLAVVDRWVYLFGTKEKPCGRDPQNYRYYLDSLESQGSWKDFAVQSGSFSQALVQRGRAVFLLGGLEDCDSDSGEVVVFDLESLQSNNLSPLSEKRHHACAVLFKDRIYLIGGARCLPGGCLGGGVEVLDSVLAGRFVAEK